MMASHLLLAILLWFLDFVTFNCAFMLPSKVLQKVSSLKARSSSFQTGTDDYQISRAAKFLSEAMYSANMPTGQRNELMRLENRDLSDRYGLRVGKRKYPSTLELLCEDEEIIGSVGLDCQLLDKEKRKFRKYKVGTELWESESIVVVLSNLAVRRDRRKQGLGKSILQHSEDIVKGWGYDEVYLLVDSQNAGAIKLYSSLGYKKIFVDDEATCVTNGDYNLQTAQCINFCMKKVLTTRSSSATGSGWSPFKAFSSFFGSK